MRWWDGGWFSHMSHMFKRARMVLARRRRHRPVDYGGRTFSPPQLLTEARLPHGSGVYAIQVRHWWSGMTPIHFGASSNLHEELMVEGHEGFVHWLNHRGAKRGLWISFDATDELDHDARHHEGSRLFRHYFPERTHTLEEHLDTHRIHHRSTEHRGHHSHDRRNDNQIR
jgi:hypothetical protein